MVVSQSVRQCWLARSLACDTQHGSDRYIATLACLLACCLLGETRPCGERRLRAAKYKRDSASPCASSQRARASPLHRGERGICCTLHTGLMLLLPLWCVLTNIFAYSRNATCTCTRASLSASATPSGIAVPIWSAGQDYATERDLMSASSAHHHKAVVSQSLSLGANTRVTCVCCFQILRRYISQQVDHCVPSGQLTVLRGGRIGWMLTAPKPTI